MADYLSLIIYIVIYGLSVFSICYGIKENKRYIAMAGVIIPALFSGLRYYVGTDYENYVAAFRMFKGVGIFKYLSNFAGEYEIGFYLLCKIADIFGGERMLFFISSLIILILMFKFIESVDIELSLPIAYFIFLITSFTSSFNILRQIIAVSITMYGIKYVLEKDLKKYIICCVVACTFHISALIVIPFYFIYDKENKSIKISRKIFIGLISAVVLSFFLPYVIGVVGSIIPLFSKFSSYFGYGLGGKNRSFFVSLIEFTVLIILGSRLKEKDSKNTYFIFLLGVGLFLEFTGFYSIFLKRLAIYFTMPSFILWAQIPLVLEDEKHKKYSQILIVLYRIFIFWLTCVLLKQGQFIPYQLNLFKG